MCSFVLFFQFVSFVWKAYPVCPFTLSTGLSENWWFRFSSFQSQILKNEIPGSFVQEIQSIGIIILHILILSLIFKPFKEKYFFNRKMIKLNHALLKSIALTITSCDKWNYKDFHLLQISLSDQFGDSNNG